MDERFQQIRRYNLWDGELLPTGYERCGYVDRIVKYIGNKLVKVLVGQRRAGKSYVLRQLANRLLKEGVDRRNILILNLDLAGFDFIRTETDLRDVVREYERQVNPDGLVYLFVDEIQNVEGWEHFVNAYSQDFTHDYEFFITGSNSRLLSGELATLLSGRYVKFEIFPFSFQEYAGIMRREPDRQTYLEYMGTGGMPELFNLPDEEVKRNYVASLKDTLLLRDIIQRYKVTDTRLLEDLFVYVTNNTSKLFSVNSIVKYYKGMGRKVSFEKISQYLDFMSDAYLIHRVERFNIQGKSTIGGVCKYYANDLSFRNYLYQGFANGAGYELENLLYLDLRRNGYEVYVGDVKGREVDFVARRGENIVYLQSTYMLYDESTIKREYASLEAIPDNYDKYVVSLDEIRLPSRNGIKHVRAWEFQP
ncbi:MAG: ATP-binding protein [Prevotella sp.]|nr:ATP-binding protein [Prevotella sp.]